MNTLSMRQAATTLADHGACTRHPDPGLFILDHPTPDERVAAAYVCSACTVSPVCRDYAQNIGATAAVWAGTWASHLGRGPGRKRKGRAA